MAKKTRIKMPSIKFDELSVEEKIKRLETQTEKLIKRLPKLKDTLTLYDDKSNELYNLEPEQIKLLTKVQVQNIRQGRHKVSTSNYAQQLEKYSQKTIRNLRSTSTEERIKSFIENIRNNSESDEEVAYVKEMLSKLTFEQQEKFVRSKFYTDSSYKSCTSMINFINEYGISANTAKLETFLEKEGIQTDRRYFVEGETKFKLGRHKKSK